LVFLLSFQLNLFSDFGFGSSCFLYLLVYFTSVADAIVQVEIRVRFDSLVAVNDVSFSLAQRRTASGLIGPTRGETPMLRAMACL